MQQRGLLQHIESNKRHQPNQQHAGSSSRTTTTGGTARHTYRCGSSRGRSGRDQRSGYLPKHAAAAPVRATPERTAAGDPSRRARPVGGRGEVRGLRERERCAPRVLQAVGGRGGDDGLCKLGSRRKFSQLAMLTQSETNEVACSVSIQLLGMSSRANAALEMLAD